MNRIATSCLVSLLVVLPAAANVKFACPFSSNMVLQRDRDVPVWGAADPDKAVTVTVRAEQKSGEQDLIRTVKADEHGRWSVKLPPHAASPKTSYSVTAQSGADSATLKNVLFGDVWICAGQSNMEMNYGWGLKNGKEDMETNVYANVRLLIVPNLTSFNQQTDFGPAKWSPECSFKYAHDFSACGYFFGAALHRAMPDLPIGLVDMTWSGTFIETWLSTNSLAAIDTDTRAKIDRRRDEINAWIATGRAAYPALHAAWVDAFDPLGHAKPAPFEPGYDASAWKPTKMPQVFEAAYGRHFDGTVWYRRSFDLTAEQAAAKAVVSLGAVDDEDAVYLNGVKVGGTSSHDFRRYDVKPGILKAGANEIVIRITDYYNDGGIFGKDGDLKLVCGGADVPLAGDMWRCHVTPRPAAKEPANLDHVKANTFAACYNAMACPLFPLAVKGAIWYQGCSNVGNHKFYDKAFRAMAADWRANFSGGDFPIYIVQLAAFQGTNKNPFDSRWAAMRWTQTRLGESVKNCGTVSIIDKGEHNDIHPKDKKTVGERLARLARVRTYGEKDLVECGPIPLAAASAEGVKVTFKNAAGLKTADGAELKGFQIRTSDTKTFAWATAKIVGDTVVVDVPAGKTAAAVRYAWDDYPVCNLVNGADLPCGPFELDVQ